MECDAIPVDYVDDAEIQAIDLAMAAAGALQAPGTRVLGAPKEADLDQETRDPRRGLIKGILQGQGPSITLSPFRPTIKGTGADEGQWLGGVGGCSAETPEGPGSPSKLRRLAMEDGILPQPPAIGAQLSPSASSPTSTGTKSPGDATRDLEEGGDAVEAGQGGVLLLQEARGKGRNLEEENETLRREVESLKERIEALEEDVDDAREAVRSSEEDRTRERKRLEDKVAQREAEAKAFRDAWRDGEVNKTSRPNKEKLRFLSTEISGGTDITTGAKRCRRVEGETNG
jgi:outer membrane murein-binding lipoprotein Lpp